MTISRGASDMEREEGVAAHVTRVDREAGRSAGQR
jgi:hypothetical protein